MSSRSHSRRIKVTIDVSVDEKIYITKLAKEKNITISELVMSLVKPNILYDAPSLET